jgi:thioredoxin reductase (NADPH)
MLSGRKLQTKAAIQNARHHVNRIGRQMKESSRSLMKQTRYVQYIDIAASDSYTETFDVVVVGCGPSGLTAALFASRMGMSVLVLGSPSTGSLAGTDALDNFPGYTSSSGGKGWLELTMDQAAEFGAKFAPPTFLATGLHKSSEEFEVSLNKSEVKIHSRTLIIASGSNPRKLNLPHESELWGRSLHNCALCDGDAYGPRQNAASNDEKSVVVVGGGEAAVEAVSLLARIGVHTIHWIHRRDEFRANAAEVKRVKSLPNVQLWTPFVVVEWIVKENGHDGKKSLDGARIVGSKDGEADPGANSSLTLPCDGAFLMIGSTPNTNWLSGVDIDDVGLIRLQSHNSEADNTPFLSTQTSVPGIFAAGEAVDGVYRQALTAASDGAKSAMDAERFLRLSATPIVPVTHERRTEQKRNSRDDDDGDSSEIECDLTESSCISQIVSKHPVVIFSKSFCSYCLRAKEAMEAEGVTPLVFELDFMGRDGKRVQETLEDMTGRRTVPNVFVGGNTIGGGSETVELHESGELRRLLQRVKAV